jgi:hypothetical protein
LEIFLEEVEVVEAHSIAFLVVGEDRGNGKDQTYALS